MAITSLGRNVLSMQLWKRDADRGVAWPPESWACIDCGVNTAPGLLNRRQLQQALARDWADQGVEQYLDEFSEVYIVKNRVWRAAGMSPFNGCLCIGCLERRLGRTLTPEDFPLKHALNCGPGTKRLLERRGHNQKEQQS
ncbi:hypothetical protein ACFQZO_24000 [Bradyrhizobium sp. GCM10027634]|uniref:hypothetical protein n=1 Tax=unclassified Bradyrhizobium TaxID=2631580 RepID=UPI00188D267C|nr:MULTISPECIES: hypothetical protein [unclassified Bradyrhizobium]MDN5003904.1 hypothetical protein [Bradyrhizobium sp. WYCCWR 12677]QOZ45435.1 hypothetical protein XH89_19555 [Bradyrhizobium sp. CCBAU 53340]